MNYLIDTNVVSEVIKLKPNKQVVSWFAMVPNESLYLSVLTLGEVRKGIGGINEATKKDKLRIWLEHELPAWFDTRILGIDARVAERWGRLLVQHKKALPAIDGLIASTALHYDLCLVTKNTTDFQSICDLQTINPWEVIL